MILAKNNILIKASKREPEEYYLLNPIAGSFDIMDKTDYEQYCKLERGENPDPSFTEMLMERGYLFETKESEQSAILSAFSEFEKEAAQSRVQLLLIPSYSCNLACTYCFQHGIDGRPQLMSKETVDAFFQYAKEAFGSNEEKPFITLFGGEPLVNSPAQREIIAYVATRCKEEGYEISAVTNGYDFKEYAPILNQAVVREIQFTLDGTKQVHDSRRMTANGKGSFDRVIGSIEEAILLEMPINLRVVTDKENVDDLVNLATLLDQKGWLDLPPERFKTQIGRNYELFACAEQPEQLFSQAELWAYVAKLAEQHPVVKKFHRPDFMGLRYLIETGEMYLPSFDTCPAAKSEWVFDLYGDIYGCTASCGREEFRLGTFWPSVALEETKIQQWKKRNTTNIEECKNCKYDVICGGGCGVLAANHHEGRILAPDCRPIRELYETGMQFYEKEIRALAESAEELGTCEICGQPLVFAQISKPMKCQVCGESFESRIVCREGHFVCDHCHGGDVLSQMEQVLSSTKEENPIRLAELLFALPTMRVHGPEHHSLVPAVLETAYQNISGLHDPAKIKEAIRRGADVKGGSCGFHGNCGACVGAGIAESIRLGATPTSKEERGRSMRATAEALMACAQFGGPLCCKRESITAITSYMKQSGRYENADQYVYQCGFSTFNKGCLTEDCPYYPNEKSQESLRKEG